MTSQQSHAGAVCLSKMFRYAILVLVVSTGYICRTQAQAPSFSPVIITPPIVDVIDENFVSILSGKVQFTISGVKLGDVSFTAFSVDGPYFQAGGEIADENYGSIVPCQSQFANGTSGSYTGCAVGGSVVGMQVIYGQERSTFILNNGSYGSYTGDGSTFVDNVTANSTCTWTKSDGTQIIYYGYHAAGNPVCQSNNIYQIIHPDGRIATYYYYGALSTIQGNSSPILSIATNSGYLLKYNYTGTPVFGMETSVMAINRAFETCNPAATSCTLAAAWPTATLTFQNKLITTSDNFNPFTNYNPYLHYIFTIRDMANRQHVFELDSYSRVISYQPPQATSPVYLYSLCSLMSDGKTLSNCFGQTSWSPIPNAFYLPPMMWDLVSTVTRNGKVWNYGAQFGFGSPPGWSTWGHSVNNPLGLVMSATGNATPGMESFFGPIDHLSKYDGTLVQYVRSTQNYISTVQTPAGIVRQYSYLNANTLTGIAENAVPGSTLSPVAQSATYPSTCTNIVICSKPTSVKDANGNQTSFTYDPTHGGVLTQTGPAVNGIRPQTRKTYIQRYAWYFNNSGVMARETHPIWLPATESYCISGAASAGTTLGAECTLANDEVDTTYQYGADSGPNNLILRGMSVTSGGATLQTCYGHDRQGNKIWETSPNAKLSGCTDY